MSSKMFDPHYWNLETLCKQIYNVPFYQRPYSWDTEEVQVLLEDLNDAFKTNNNDKYDGYFIGNIIVHDKNEKINGQILLFEIIDGQQRITTFVLILLALYCLINKRSYDITDKTVQSIKQSLWKYVDRKYVKEYRTVNLKSIEKETFQKLYDYCFNADKPGFDVLKYCKEYIVLTKFDQRIINNFKHIYNYLDVTYPEQDSFLNYADYILNYAQFIVIQCSCNQPKVFSMFESINSKGKKLDDIDLFKTYIFSNLTADDETYEKYLDVWGDLIIKTDDNLYDYIYTFIKAYIYFYRQNISIKNFKSICQKDLISFYNKTSLSDALAAFLDDLKSKVDFYNMLSSVDQVYKLIGNNKLRYFYKIFVDISYQHPKALFFRTLIEYKNGIIEDKGEAVAIINGTIKYMIKFLTIGQRDSKDAISMFANIMNEVYKDRRVTKDVVEYFIANELIRQSIIPEKLKLDLSTFDAYEQNRKLTIALLALYDSSEIDSNGKLKLSYDQAFLVMNLFSSVFSLDHLLVQTPNKEDTHFKYYKDEAKNELVLKENNDFPKDKIQNSMDYDMFTKIILNNIGNLRIFYKDKNSCRQNTSIALKEYSNFYNYCDVEKRAMDIANVLIDDVLASTPLDPNVKKVVTVAKREDGLPKMAELIEYGLVKPGDYLYLTNYPENSEALLVDDKSVEYKGKLMSLNDWGCEVTHWKSIRIYAYAAIKGEIETLHDKRLKFIAEQNENATNNINN